MYISMYKFQHTYTLSTAADCSCSSQGIMTKINFLNAQQYSTIRSSLRIIYKLTTFEA